jgi:hypothetical protein
MGEYYLVSRHRAAMSLEEWSFVFPWNTTRPCRGSPLVRRSFPPGACGVKMMESSLHPLQQRDQFVGFQGVRALVVHRGSELGSEAECLHQLDPLLLANHNCQSRIGIDCESVQRGTPRCACGPGRVDFPRLPGMLAPERNVLSTTCWEPHVLLVDHPDTVGNASFGERKRTSSPLIRMRPSSGMIQTPQHVHQRCLARPFSHIRVPVLRS